MHHWAGGKPSWTARLLQNPELLCSKVREEAGELCQTLEQSEGQERAASEMADLLYHSMVLLNLQVTGSCLGKMHNMLGLLALPSCLNALPSCLHRMPHVLPSTLQDFDLHMLQRLRNWLRQLTVKFGSTARAGSKLPDMTTAAAEHLERSFVGAVCCFQYACQGVSNLLACSHALLCCRE